MDFTKEHFQNNSHIRPIGLMDELKCRKIVDVLNTLLAQEYVLFTKTLNYHWNFKGPRFNPMHEFLDDQYNDILEIMDNVAERVKIFDAYPLATARELLERSSIDEAPEQQPSPNEMLFDLFNDHQLIQEYIKSQIAKEDLFKDDPGTEDMLTGILRDHEMTSWVLKSNITKNWF